MTDKLTKPERKKRKLEKQGHGLKNRDIDLTNETNITNVAASLEEKKWEGQTDKKEDQVSLVGNSLPNSELPGEVCEKACVCSPGVPGTEKFHADLILSTEGDSRPDYQMSRSKRRRLRRRKRKKEQERNALKDNDIDFHMTNTEVAANCDASHISEVVGSKLRSIGGKSAVIAVEKSALSFFNDVKGQQQEIDAKGDPTVSNMGNPKAKKRKRKRVKTKEVSDPFGNTLEVTEDSGAGQSLLAVSSKIVSGIQDRDSGQGFACSELANKEENSTNADKSGDENLTKAFLVERKDEKDTEIHHDAIGALGVDHISERKKKRNRKKKKKSCVDHETANMDSKKETDMKIVEGSIDGMVGMSLTDDVSIPQKDEEREVDSLTRDVAQDSVVQEAVPEETGKQLHRCKCRGHVSKKLLVLDLNGILVDVVHGHTTTSRPDGKIFGRSVFRRPFVHSFLKFCFNRFDVGIWSSRRVGLHSMIQMVMRNFENRLLFQMDRNKCTKTKFNTLENDEKPLVMKDLRKVWDRFGSCRSCRKRKYDETNTLLVDDSPYKALCNPPHTGVFPYPYKYTDREDSALGPNGDLRLYLERLADAENVQKYIEENPFGQPAISKSHSSWEFYSKVLQSDITKSGSG